MTLEDLDPTAAFFVQQFEPGATLSFVLNATDNFTGPVRTSSRCSSVTPRSPCYSDDASGALLLLDLVGGPLSPASFVLSGASPQGLPAPVVSVTTPAPEPGTLWLFAAGAAAAAVVDEAFDRVSTAPGAMPYSNFTSTAYTPRSSDSPVLLTPASSIA